ncbi:uncharacterized protein BYT42DRAFT_616520 [Radiomyces spectabilis]|uniref:uncharacterized protein n=1 Tax=Radiomyces spectabilis TaxID=64574 RepID=UPI002220AD96|nr:uncharacterized protein BYT42DRAFT_616520 [Radiomyces spectabilis]KAI8371429.1 hypothetical protein BYT42DRAFT_616520 [Radiomyces spectabilis]
MTVATEAVSKASALSKGGKNLFQLLSGLPSNGVGSRVAPNKFVNNPALQNSYYEVTKVNLKEGNNHGRAWGVQILKGRTIDNGKPMEIRGGLKFKWKVLQ